jgi:hypothetical protein
MALNSSRKRFDFMMRGTQALAIVEIEQGTSIAKLNHMVGVHAVLGPCPATPMAIGIDCLAPTASTGYHLSSPRSELGRAVYGILLLGR